MGSELSVETYPVLGPVLDFDPDMWRDTVIVPPNGRTRIWVHYKNYTGKTVMHCHFLAHEDTGMMSTLFIGVPEPTLWRVVLVEHWEIVLGAGVGVLLTSVLLLVCGGVVQGRRRRSSDVYGAVPMNELKSKAMD